MKSSTPFLDLEPASLWGHFEAITKIARPSRHEAKMVEHILSWASTQKLHVERDGVGNVCVSVPATQGRERTPTVVMQSHLDMVCERNSDSPFDPEKGKINAYRDGDWIIAEGTTLGADNGIGVATMLSVGEALDVVHGPLELLFTLDEETGLTGAKNLDPSLLHGRTLLNLDSEDDGILYVGCAGGSNLRIQWTAQLQPVSADWRGLKVAVSGLQGGHSGVDIHKNRLNAIRATVRLLQEAAKNTPLLLAQLHGGNKSNAIPRESHAAVFCRSGELAKFRTAVDQTQGLLAAQYRGLEDGLKVTIEEHASPSPLHAFSVECTRQVLDLVRTLPAGPIAMSQDIPGLVETSSNLAVVRTEGNMIEITCSSRSSVAGAMRDILDTHHAIARLAGAHIEEQEGYPGWKPDLSSRALAITKQAFRRLFGSDPAVTAVHAGLECGLIGERVPGMDMVSFGPQISGAHAPGERVHIPSVAKFWKLLAAVLDDLSR